MAQEQKRGSKHSKKRLLILAIIGALILVLIAAGITYAYFKSAESNNGVTNAVATLDCINISYSEENIIDLTYNYPVSDEYALSNVVPVTVKVENHCTNNLADVNYALTITSLANEVGYISDSKIRAYATKKINNNEEELIYNTGYLNKIAKLHEGNVLTSLNSELSLRTNVKDYKKKKSYILHEDSISNKSIHTYKVYLWVDYYEGDKKMYDTENYPGYVHDESYDNSTEGQNFAAAISLVINPSYEEDYGKPKYLSDTIMALENNGQVIHEEFSYDVTEPHLNNTTKLAADSSVYTSVTPDETYGFTADTTNNTWKSGNTNVSNSTSSIEFVPKETAGYQLCYNMYTEYNYDYGIIYVDDVEIYNAYGKGMDDSETYTCVILGELSSSNIIKVSYKKDGSVNTGNDQFIFYINKGDYSEDVQTFNVDAGYRYEGSSVDNYLTFNNEETWRIVGVQEGSAIGLEEGKYYTKIVNTNSYANAAYDDNCLTGDYSCGLYEMNLYDYASNIDETSYNMLVSPKWYYGGYDEENPVANNVYKAERNNSNYQLTNNVGIVSLSDVMYANGWFHDFGNDFWTITPYTDDYSAWYYSYENSNIAYTGGDSYYNVYPSVYLSSEVTIDDGNGSSGNPFIVSLETDE